MDQAARERSSGLGSSDEHTGERSVFDQPVALEERFTILGKLGEGGMGLVSRAYDQDRAETVALKTLTSHSNIATAQFKEEFRAIAGLHHPHLVKLYGLYLIDESLVLTMELVDGTDSKPTVRSRPAEDQGEETQSHLSLPTLHSGGAPTLRGTGRPPSAQWSASLGTFALVKEEILRRALGEIASAVHYLHCRGRLHRDIKPSNVMIENGTGRAVLLDFGLAARQGESSTARAAGTVPYLAPELIEGKPATPASDWYAFGVLMFDYILGRLPFQGTSQEILTSKLKLDAVAPHLIDPNVPVELSLLCERLLARNPSDRPSGAEVVKILNAPLREVVIPVRERLIGREPELALAADALQLVEVTAPSRHLQGPRVTYLAGRSGFGKSSLANGLADLARQQGYLVLRSRCSEGDYVPFKAFDQIADTIGELIQEWRLVVPDLIGQTSALARLFPAISFEEDRSAHESVSGELGLAVERSEAFRALRRLLREIDRKVDGLVLHIEDLQWLDPDSTELLLFLLEGDDAAPVRVMGTYRSEAVSAAPQLRRLLSSDGALGLRATTLTVGPLSAAAAEAVANVALQDAGADEASLLADARRVASVSGGNPLLIRELASMINQLDEHAAIGEFSLNAVLARRVAKLPVAHQRIMELVAVSAHPTPRRVLAGAMRTAEADYILASLAAQNLVHRHVGSTDDYYEAFHDAIRETTCRLIGDRTADIHRALATSYEREGIGSREALVAHWLGAGENTRAGHAALKAAVEARAVLAFDRAATLYTIALDNNVGTSQTQRDRANCLALAGRSDEAGEAFLDLVPVYPTERDALESRAAMQFMSIGNSARGMDVLRQVAARAGVPLPRSKFSALVSLLFRDVLLSLRRRTLPKRLPTEKESQQHDVAWVVGQCLSLTDTVLSQAVGKLEILWASRASTPIQFARAMILEAGQTCPLGTPKALAKSRAALARIDELEGVDEGTLIIRDVIRGFVHYQASEFRDAALTCHDAINRIRMSHPGERWALATGQMCHVWALYYLGDAHGMQRRVEEYRRENDSAGSVYGGSVLRIGVPAMAELLLDEPTRALENLQQARTFFPTTGYQLEHCWADHAEINLALYTGRYRDAWHTINAIWASLHLSGLLIVSSLLRAESHYLRARAAIGMAAQKPSALRLARKSAAQLGKEAMPWQRALGMLIDGSLAHPKSPSDAAALYVQAAAEFTASDVHGLAKVARYRAHEALGETTEAAERLEELRASGVVAPEKFVRQMSPVIGQR